MSANNIVKMRMSLLLVLGLPCQLVAQTTEITLISQTVNNGSFEKDTTGTPFSGGSQDNNLQFWKNILASGPIGTMKPFTATSARNNSSGIVSHGAYSAQVNRGGNVNYYGLLGDTGYLVQAGDTFNLSFDWFPSSAWVATDKIEYLIYTAKGAAGNPSNAILSGVVTGYAQNAGKQTLALTATGSVGTLDVGESLIIEFNTNPAINNHYSRVDNVHLSVLTGNPPDPSTPVVNYSFDVDFSDSSFPNNPGQANGAATISQTFADATVGSGALALDGADTSYVDLTTPLTYSGSDEWSVAFWARRSALGSTNGMVMGDRSNTTDYIWLNDSAAGLRFASSTNAIFDFTVPQDLKYHHYVMAADGAGSLTLYRDGAFLETLTGDTSFKITTIGKADTTTGSNFSGNLDGVHVYSIALPPGDVTALYDDEEASTVKVLLLGDETTIGTIPRVLKPNVSHLEKMIVELIDAEGNLPLAHVANAGKDGEYIQQLFDSGRYAAEIAGLPKLDYIFFRYGINDRRELTNFTADFTQDVEDLITQLKNNFPGAVIIPTTIIPSLNTVQTAEVNQIISDVAAAESLAVFDLHPLYLAEENGFNMLNIRNYPLADTPAKYHAYLTQYYGYAGYTGRVLVINNEIDPLLGDLPNWFDDPSPNLAGYWYIGLQTVNFLKPLLSNP